MGGNNCAVVRQPVEVADRLAQLGLNEEVLRESAMVGVVAQRACTLNDPPTLRNLMPWGKTITGMRDRLLPTRKWRRCDVDNFSRVINDTMKVAVCVSTGDQKTGLAEGSPKTKYPKGPVLERAIDANQSFPFMADFRPVEDEEEITEVPDGLTTYILLIARTRNEVRLELSLPSGIGFGGRVSEWTERIILTPLHLEPELTQTDPNQEPGPSMDDAPTVDIDITRKE